MNTKPKIHPSSPPKSDNQADICSNDVHHADPSVLQNWVELSASAVEHNAKQFQQWLGKSTRIAAVIKSNAYGHGLIEMAQLYEACDTIAALCVINLTESALIRKQGITKPIIVIGYLDMHYDIIATYDIQVIIYDKHTAYNLNEIGKKHQKQILVHIKFDTGMSRLGLIASELDEFIMYLKTLPWISIAGIFSHLAESYKAERTHMQETVFEKISSLEQICNLQANFISHISNSHGCLTTKHKQYSYARIGIGLFGYLQKHDPEMQKLLKPVLSLKTKILQIKSVQSGALIGYDGTFQATQNMTIAIIAIGYYEGLDARLSNCGSVIVAGKLAPIIGRVCMNLTIIDISDIPDCYQGQIVTVLGRENDAAIFAYDWSALTKASVYNHLTKLSTHIPKIIV